MEFEEVRKYESKRIKLILKNGFRYNAYVQKVTEHSLLILDKYSQQVTISLDDISVIMEDFSNARI